MKELNRYAEILKNIIDRHYEKEMVFYDVGDWYSREHCRNITIDELATWVLQITDKEECYL